MAEPKKCFTAIPNELLEAVYSSDLNATELKIVLAVIRYTYGYNRDRAEMSITFIAAATRINRDFAAKCIRKLVAKGVITVYKSDTRVTSKEIGINVTAICKSEMQNGITGVVQEDVEPLVQKDHTDAEPIVHSDHTGVVQKGSVGMAQDDYSAVAQDNHQEINNINKKINKKIKTEGAYAPEITEVVELYNSVCKAYTPVGRINDFMADKITKLLEIYPLDRIETAFTYAQRSPTFREGIKGWRPNFEWLTVPDNMSTVLDGRYGGTREDDDPDYWQMFFDLAVKRSMDDLKKHNYTNV